MRMTPPSNRGDSSHTKGSLTTYEQAMRNIDRIIAELDKELEACTTQATTESA